MEIFKIFSTLTDVEFISYTLEVFKFQYTNNSIYRKFCDVLKKNPDNVVKLEDIPFLPISFFKNHKILCTDSYELLFESSATTGKNVSKHYVYSSDLYIRSFTTSFNYFYGNYKDYVWLALLPSYLERPNSSLVYMIEYFIKNSIHSESGFYLNDYESLYKKLIYCIENDKKIILFGVSFALLNFAEKFSLPEYDKLIVMETGGMKGRRKEITRNELHKILCNSFKVETIHSEYGMTELLSQAYSKGNGIFRAPKWMRVLIRDVNEPTDLSLLEKYGAINIIDLANYYSCSFIATDDVGIKHHDNTFEVVGRLDYSVERGCSLLYPY
ncbi:MAG: acyltransferase [Bacteroidales bacterium]|nr:acyltransferase [Bacteroidales bacterium]